MLPRSGADKDELPTIDMDAFSKMGEYIDRLQREGVTLAAEGLHPSSEGARINYAHQRAMVTDGPFTETKELIGGFCIVQADSKEEVVDRILGRPFGSGGSVEIRRIFGAQRLFRLADRRSTAWRQIYFGESSVGSVLASDGSVRRRYTLRMSHTT